MNEVKDFVLQKELIIEKMHHILTWVQAGKSYGLNVDEIVQKIQTVIEEVKNEKIRVALVGGFSEGKTTVVASWLGKIEKNMKIDVDESSDSIEIYRPEGLEHSCEIIDTPGLFGYREKEINLTTVRYEDITKKYISEAHIILYVLNSVNSLKDSHKESAQWLFRNLNKLSNTIFVMNRFDDVCDIEDEEDYQDMLKVKRYALTKQLRNFIELTAEEERKLHIVGIAANPFGKGLEYWQEHREHFNSLSRMGFLQEETSSLLKQSKIVLLFSQVQSVIKDVINRESADAMDALNEINSAFDTRKEATDEINRQLEIAYKSIKEKRSSLRREFMEYCDRLIVELDGTDVSSIGDFYNREIGEEGINFTTNVQDMFDRYCEKANSSLSDAAKGINEELDFRESLMATHLKKMAAQGVAKFAGIGTSNLRNAILFSRNMLRTGLGKIGVDVGLKFKPWGAVKFAKNLGGVAAVVGVAMELYNLCKKIKQQKETDKAKTRIKEFIINYKKYMLDLIKDDDNFIDNFVPSYKVLCEIQCNLNSDLENVRKQRDELFNWLGRMSDIEDVEFEELNS